MNINDIQALLNNSATIKTKINVVADGELPAIELTEQDAIEEWEYEDFRYIENEGFIGQFIARSLSGKLHNISDTFNIENREIELYLTVVRPSTPSAIETPYKLGNFIIQRPKDNEVSDNTKFEAFDYTIYFNKPFDGDYVDDYYTSSFNSILSSGSSVSAKWLAEYVCKQVGVTLGSTTFTNYNFQITSNQFNSGDSCRDVIKAIAKLACSWARIGWDNKLYIDFAVKQVSSVESYNEITADNYYTLETQKNVYGPVNRVIFGSSIVVGDYSAIEDQQSIQANGLHELNIYDNPILFEKDIRDSAITNATVLYGLQYTPMELETTGHPWLLGGELIKVKDMENNYKYTYPFNRTIKFAGHIKTLITSYAQTDIESQYTYNGSDSVETYIKQTRLVLDRDEQKLNLYIEKTDNNASSIATMDISLHGIENRVATVENNYIDGETFGRLEQSVNTLQTDTYTKTEINTKLTDGSVTKVDTTTGFTMDATGFHVDRTGAKTNSTLDEKGLTVKDNIGNDVSYTGYVDTNKIEDNPNLEAYEGQTVTYQENAIINHYLQVPKSRIEAYGTGTGVFFTG